MGLCNSRSQPPDLPPYSAQQEVPTREIGPAQKEVPTRELGPAQQEVPTRELGPAPNMQAIKIRDNKGITRVYRSRDSGCGDRSWMQRLRLRVWRPVSCPISAGTDRSWMQ